MDKMYGNYKHEYYHPLNQWDQWLKRMNIELMKNKIKIKIPDITKIRKGLTIKF